MLVLKSSRMKRVGIEEVHQSVLAAVGVADRQEQRRLALEEGLQVHLPLHAEHPAGPGVGQHVQMPGQDALDAGVHLVRLFVLEDHPHLPGKGAVGVGDPLLLHHVLQFRGPHLGQEGVGVVQAVLLLGQLVQEEEEERLREEERLKQEEEEREREESLQEEATMMEEAAEEEEFSL